MTRGVRLIEPLPGLESGHVADTELHLHSTLAPKWDTREDFEPSLFTSAHFPAYLAHGGRGSVGGGPRLPRGINKHESPEDVCKHLYLWVAVGTLAKDCRDRLFPASPRRQKSVVFISSRFHGSLFSEREMCGNKAASLLLYQLLVTICRQFGYNHLLTISVHFSFLLWES